MMGKNNGKPHPNSLKIEVTDLKLNSKTVYDSICAAAKALNCQESSIRSNIKSKRQNPYKGRYIFVYKNID
jgi:hypothetical protein